MMKLVEIEFARDYWVQGFHFASGTRCETLEGNALTLVNRGIARYATVDNRKKRSAKNRGDNARPRETESSTLA